MSDKEVFVLQFQMKTYAVIMAAIVRAGRSADELAGRLGHDRHEFSEMLGQPERWTLQFVGQIACAAGLELEFKMTAREET